VTLAPAIRRLALIVHLVFSVGWIGAVVVYLTLGISAVTSQDAETVRAAWIAMELTGRSAIVPLALGSLLTGLVMALGTPWGLTIGFCGAFTTMSTFGYESMTLLGDGQYWRAAVYIGGSLVGCLAAVSAGNALASRLL